MAVTADGRRVCERQMAVLLKGTGGLFGRSAGNRGPISTDTQGRFIKPCDSLNVSSILTSSAQLRSAQLVSVTEQAGVLSELLIGFQVGKPSSIHPGK